MTRLPEQPRRSLVLTRHFFNRIFQNEIIPFEEQMKEKMVAAWVMLAVLGGHIAISLFGRYGMMEKYIFLVKDPGSWADKCYFISFFSALLALLVVLDWEAMFLDERDARNLLVLPLKSRTVFRTKFASFFIFITLYTAAVNAVATGVVVFFLPQFRSKSLVFLIRYAAAHWISTTAAFVFTFFLFALINAVFLIVFPPLWYRRIAWIFRFVLLIGLMALLMMFVINSLIKPNMFGWIRGILENGKGIELFFPPLWFTGLYEILLGNKSPIFEFGAAMALVAVCCLPLLYFMAMSLCYGRILETTGAFHDRLDRLSKPKKIMAGLFSSLALRHPTERAVFYFVSRTLKTSAPHRMKIIGYLALGCGLSFILLFVPGISSPFLSIRQANVLAAPIIIGFFLILGLRSAVLVPTSGEANWIFRLTEKAPRARYFTGLKKAFVVRILVPLFSIIFLFYALLWNFKYAGLHVLYAFALALVLLELFFWKFNKFPFACLSLPGKMKFQFYWIAYAFGGYAFIRGSSLLEKYFFEDIGNFWIFFGAVIVLLIGLRTYQNIFYYSKARLIFEEAPEKTLILLEE